MKLSALPIILIGLAVGVVVLSYAYFHEYAPNTQQAAFNTEQGDLLEAEANQLGKAQQRVKDAEKMVREKEDAWALIVARRTLPARLGDGGINVNQDAWHLAIDARKFRNSAQRAVNAQVKKGGVTVINGPSVPFPDDPAPSLMANYFNYPAVPFPVVIYDFGTVTVRGTYNQIRDNVRSWSNMPNYLAVTDGLQITGTSPNLTATYNLSIVGYIEATGVFPQVPEVAGSGSALGGPPAGIGGPGRPGGGPPAGFGGPGRPGGGPPMPAGVTPPGG